MTTRFDTVFEAISRAWCYIMHPDPLWPVNGYYRCPRCHRTYRVAWEPVTAESEVLQSAATVPVEFSPAFKAIAAAVLFMLAVPALAQTGQGPSALLPESGLVRTVHRELLILPGYTVFDYLAAKQLDDGSVLLTGYATKTALKQAAESTARSIAGATIVNRIEVLPRSQRDDRLRAAAWREIYGDPSMLSYATRKLVPIHIIVKDGRVTVEGTVDSGLDRMQVDTALQQLPVTAVRNRLIAMQDAGASTLSSLWRSATATP